MKRQKAHMKRYRTNLSAAVLGLSLAGICIAQPTYTYTVIPTPAGTQYFSPWVAADGTIRGGSGTVDAGDGIQLRQCYTYKDGTFTVVPTPSANCYLAGASKSGDFAGILQFPGDQASHFFKYHDGGFEMLDGLLPRTLPGPTLVGPTAMNDQGDVAGWVEIQDLKPYTIPFAPPRATPLYAGTIETYGFLYSGGSIRELPKLSNAPVETGISTLGPYDYANGMNSKGDLVGYAVLHLPGSLTDPYVEHAVLWPHDGGIVDLGTVGGTWSQANGINASGQIVGRSSVRPDEYDPTRHNLYHAFLYENGSMKALPVPAICSVAQGITEQGEVVGYYYLAKDDGSTVDFSESYSFFWYPDGTADGKLADLQTLVPSLPNGMVLTSVQVMNGQLTARARQTDGSYITLLLTRIQAQ